MKEIALHISKTFLVSTSIIVVAFIVNSSKNPQSLEIKQALFLEHIACFFLIILLTISSFPSFLGQHQMVKKNAFLHFLSFFLLPIILTMILFISNSQSSEQLSFFLTIGVFFLIHSI